MLIRSVKKKKGEKVSLKEMISRMVVKTTRTTIQYIHSGMPRMSVIRSNDVPSHFWRRSIPGKQQLLGGLPHFILFDVQTTYG